MAIKSALISVSDKTGLTELAQGLDQLGITILSTGGTAKLLQEAGINVTEVSNYTGFPEMLDGRLKTLHPKIHGGILARREQPDHMLALKKANIPTIDLVIINLYPFGKIITKPDCSLEEAIENIDIGGPTLIRAAAKNYRHVTIVTSPEDYEAILLEISANNSTIQLETRFKLAQKAFSHTANYDNTISNYLTAFDTNNQKRTFPENLNLNFNLRQELRYGENPHQKGAFYGDSTPIQGGSVNYKQLQGKALSFNNIADTDTAWECVKTFDSPACVIVKHANPCGAAMATTPLAAYKLAFATDTTSAFGGIIAFNCTLDETACEAIIKQFVEVIAAPAFTEAAKQMLAQKTNVRVLAIPMTSDSHQFDFKRVGGGILVQTPDNWNISANELKVVTKVLPTAQQSQDFLFAWRVTKFVKSNAVVFCENKQTLGIGAGQMSRVDSARIATIKAQQAGLSLKNSIVASDAFFPFRDGLDVVVEAGAKAIIQPGGSVRDEEVIAAADEHGITMVFSGVRHFRH